MSEYEELMERLEDAEALREADDVLAAIGRGEEEVTPWERVRDRIGSEYDPDEAAGS